MCNCLVIGADKRSLYVYTVMLYVVPNVSMLVVSIRGSGALSSFMMSPGLIIKISPSTLPLSSVTDMFSLLSAILSTKRSCENMVGANEKPMLY